MSTKILILGAGFAGVNAVKYLAPFAQRYDLDIKLINEHRWSLFAPLLPDLISGRINPEHIAYDLGSFCKKNNTRFIHDKVLNIDLDSKIVQTKKGIFNADFILICIGCQTNYYGNEDFMHKIPGLKTLHEGIIIRNLCKKVLDESNYTLGKKANILIVGAGYTGFEVASHVALYASQYCDCPISKLSQIVNIMMVDHDDKILADTTPGVQTWAKKFIENYDVQIRVNVTVKDVNDKKAILTDNSVYEDSFLIWTAGVTPGPACRVLDVPKQRGGRLAVDQYLRLTGFTNIFSAGDVAGPIPKGHDQPLRMGVQFSLVGGLCAAKNILNSIKQESLTEFIPFDPGYVIPLGPGHAMSVILGHEMYGRIPFFLHYIMSIYRSWGLKNKFAVMNDLFAELMPWPNKKKKHQRIDGIHRMYWDKNPPPKNNHLL